MAFRMALSMRDALENPTATLSEAIGRPKDSLVQTPFPIEMSVGGVPFDPERGVEQMHQPAPCPQ